MKIKIFIWFFVILIGFFISHAGCPPECTEDIYQTGDYALIDDWAQVDWTKIDYSKPELYQTPEFYNNLPDDYYWRLDYRKVKFNLIDHEKIDESKYLQDFGCADCSFVKVSRDGKPFPEGFIFSEDGIQHPEGDFVSIPGTYPPGTVFIADTERIVINLPPEVASVEIPQKDSVTLSIPREITLITPEGELSFSGELSSRNGQAYVKGGDKSVVGGIEITPQSEGINVYADGEKHAQETNDYISLNPKKKKMVISANDDNSLFNLNFTPGNGFLNVEEGDVVQMGTLSGVEVDIQNRDSEGLVPLVKVRQTDSEFSRCDINSGMVSVKITQGRWAEESGIETVTTGPGVCDNCGSSAMTIIIEDSEGKNMLGTEEEPKKIVIDNFNNLVAMSMEDETIEIEILYPAVVPIIVSERISFNYDPSVIAGPDVILVSENPSNDELDKMVLDNPGKLIITGPGATDPRTLNNLMIMLNSMPPDTRNSIKAIVTYDDETWASEIGEMGGVCFEGGLIYMPVSMINQGTLPHEAGHARHFDIILSEEEAMAAELYPLTFYGAVETIVLGPKSFNEKWAEAAGDPEYGLNIVNVYLPDYYTEWTDDPDRVEVMSEEDSQKHLDMLQLLTDNGFVSEEQYNYILELAKNPNTPPYEGSEARGAFEYAYGATNVYEHVATEVEDAYGNPEKVASKIKLAVEKG